MSTLIASTRRNTTRGSALRWILCVFLVGLGLMHMGMGSAQAASNRLTGVDAVSTSNSGINIRLKLDSAAPVPSVFTVNEPARLSIDLPATELAVAQRYQRIDQGPVQAIAMAASNDRTRVVIELSSMVDYQVNRQGNEIIVGIGSGAAQSASKRPLQPVASSAAPDTAAPSAPAPSGPSVRDIDFRRGDSGSGRIEISLSGVTSPVNVSEEGGQIVAQLPGVALPNRLQKRFDVLDFATPVKNIDATARNGGTRIVVTPVAGADFEQIAYQTGDQFFIELQPLSETEKAQREKDTPRYTGEKISLSFQNIDVRSVLQIIADVADVNMVVSDSVTGNMALRLEDVAWDQALDIIMNAKGLGMRRENNVITIAPLAEIAAREQAELVAQQATTNLAPLRSEIIQINYARAADIASLLRSGSSSNALAGPTGQPGVPPANNDLSLMSARGQVTVDDRTNSLLINETREKLDEIRRLINRLDIPVRQVLIESRIVVANREFSRNLGVTQGVTDNAAFESPSGGNYLANSGYTVNLPVANPAGTITTSIIGDTFNLDLALSALESENRGEIISAPRVITANAKEAKIEQGVEIPYLEAASSGAATVEFKEAVLGLTVTPQITPDSRVIMDLFVTQDTQGDTINVQGGGSVPSINTRSLTTQVLVDDGETVVLGGIYEQENRDISDRVPILSEIPLLGVLFRGTQRQRDKRELLIFVTPKILRDQLSLK
ncbi:type IV pilus secretin PilQ [Salinisphaera aquimarina]|uniref:Type IV pilus secretin PilQ n=1 Tax=Salinisphaera aquimarina TaxID=2094031 RepID=A0ABV7ELS6_9GAMM